MLIRTLKGIHTLGCHGTNYVYPFTMGLFNLKVDRQLFLCGRRGRRGDEGCMEEKEGGEREKKNLH